MLVDPRLIVVSNAVKQSIIQRLGYKKVRVIYNGLYKHKKRNKINVKKILKIKNTNKNIIMVCVCVCERKGHDFMIKTFIDLKKYKKTLI